MTIASQTTYLIGDLYATRKYLQIIFKNHLLPETRVRVFHSMPVPTDFNAFEGFIELTLTFRLPFASDGFTRMRKFKFEYRRQGDSH